MRRDERVIGAWHYEIQYGPEGEANYAWLYRGAEMVATMKTHHAAALTAALEVEQPVAVEEWQPIETAPKGVRGVAWMLLAYGPEGDQTVGVGMRFHDQFFAASTFYTGGPHDGRQFEFREHEVRPTHWRPLPTPPSSPRTSASSAEAGGSATLSIGGDHE
ncbi:DUF551 domain-containing protein [Shinella granuli]|uniref:Uncharacterized protein DUF551 n=1 Tax=Shinella granuli TaxID=323621 RepID=A0A4R2D1E9_SHIGR|nr:DUF551 domain-containing protein [Shinella granuli]TCN48057.1 uncharacterized protein DUF551 [Shinella granuli]